MENKGSLDASARFPEQARAPARRQGRSGRAAGRARSGRVCFEPPLGSRRPSPGGIFPEWMQTRRGHRESTGIFVAPRVISVVGKKCINKYMKDS